MAKTSKKAIGTAMAGIMAVGAVAGTVNSIGQVNVANAAESKAQKDAKAKINHLIYSINTNYAGLKNQAQWEAYVKEAKTLIAKMPSAEKVQANAFTKQVDGISKAIMGIARINQVEKSLLPKSQGGFGNYVGIKNVPAWKTYLGLATEDLKAVDQTVFAAKYAELVERLNKASVDVQKIEDDFKIDYDKAVALYNDAKTSSNLTKAEAALVAAKDLGTCAESDKLELDCEALIDTIKNSNPEVVAVNSINATQVEVKFNKAVDPTSLFTEGNSGAFKATVTFRSIDSVTDGTLSGKLSTDGKTLTVTSTKVLEKRYDVVIDNIKTTDDKDIAKYSAIITINADKIAPSIVSTSRITSTTFKVVFSEPIKSLGTVSYKLANGTVVAGSGKGVTNDFVAGAKEVIFTVGSDVAANKEVIATIIGAQDQAGNLLTPNPATVSLVKGDKDGVAPTVASITQTGAKTFAVKFSEELQAKPTVKINGTTVDAGNLVKDTTDATKYNVTASAVLDGATTVAVESFADLSGEAGTNVNRVVTFVKETAAPKVVSSAVVTDGTNKKEYLEFTFDKDVELSTSKVAATSASYVKDYVTTTIGAIAGKTVDYKVSTNKKVVRVDLATLLNGNDIKGAAYSLKLSFSGVTSGAGVAADTTTASFTRGEDGVVANTTVVAVKSVAQGADNNKVNVTFDNAVDGASATNAANYKIDGAVVESVTLNPAETADGVTTQVAVLNLKDNSNSFSGIRNVNIANVKALQSTKTMNAYAGTVSINENVVPIVVSAKLTDSDKVTVTFSEEVTNAEADTNDFELYIGGVKVSANDVVTTSQQTTGATTLVLTLEKAVTADDIAKGLTLKALDTLDIQDSASNKASVSSSIVINN
ncbi:hypothetical protein [Clostridium cylindrosporum]|uniref:Uncharacterized protein n=1 Tax=Clostridium cylindrosporum DSM 605 TaxID=1121307 RepID=A0A0J8DF70_CLOCY|nr:hypothetical protein [Clostridium cylindrosporum]KMT22899.1 hypothetical protein CLCY_5c01380 [Clostridium cylindrosporum DSM 605]